MFNFGDLFWRSILALDLGIRFWLSILVLDVGV